MDEEDIGKVFIENGMFKTNVNGKIKTLGRAIYVESTISNVDTDEVKVQFSFEDNNKLITKSLKRDKVTKSGILVLTKYGADCWNEVAAHYTKYFRQEIKKTKRSYEHSKVGWGSYNDITFFKLYKAIGFESTYNSSQYNIEPKGTLKEWLKVVRQEVLGKQWLEFALAAGFTAPLLKIIEEEASMDSLFINFYGMSSTGKTVATKLAVSPFGLPDKKGNGLMQSWYGTDQGLLSSLKGNFGIPLAIDDTSTQEDDKDFTQFIYLIAAGKDKAALNPDGTNRGQEEWITTVFSSSETSILQKTDERSGIRVRFFEINEKSITDSAENAENIERVITKNYGHAGIEYVTHIISLGAEEIYKRWNQHRKDLLKKMDTDPFSKRIAGKLAVVSLAGELANESLKLKLNLNMLTESLLKIEKKSLTTRDIGERAYTHIMEYFASNISKFFKDKDDSKYKYKGEVLGKYIQKDGMISEIRIPADKFKKIIERARLDVNQVITLWKEKDLIKYDKGKNTLSRVFQPGMPKMSQYSIIVRDSSAIYSKVNEQCSEADKDEQEQNAYAKIEQQKQEAYYQHCMNEEGRILEDEPLGSKRLAKKKERISIKKGASKIQIKRDDDDLGLDLDDEDIM